MCNENNSKAYLIRRLNDELGSPLRLLKFFNSSHVLSPLDKTVMKMQRTYNLKFCGE